MSRNHRPSVMMTGPNFVHQLFVFLCSVKLVTFVKKEEGKKSNNLQNLHHRGKFVKLFESLKQVYFEGGPKGHFNPFSFLIYIKITGNPYTSTNNCKLFVKENFVPRGCGDNQALENPHPTCRPLLDSPSDHS